MRRNFKLFRAIAVMAPFVASTAFAVTDIHDDVSASPWTVPAGVTSITLTAWGAGGGGSGGIGAGGGGAGGNSCTKTISVTAGELITWTIGSGGVGATSSGTGGSGDLTTVVRSGDVEVRAAGGEGGQANGGGAPGLPTACTLVSGTSFLGGSGGPDGGLAATRGGGGGGGSATTAANGTIGSAGSSGSGGAGGPGEATGGDGGDPGLNGQAGSAPGSGGGGSGGNNSTNAVGGSGAGGRVAITYADCSNGVVEAGEQCDDSNNLNGDCCSSTCQYEVFGSECEQDDDFCTFDGCDGAGTCNPEGVRNCDDSNGCTDDSCNESTDNCDNANNTEPCGDSSDTECDNPDSCLGGSCQDNFEPDTTECRADTGECDLVEYCDGSGSCPVDAFESNGSPCGDPTDTDCDDPDTCDGANDCVNNLVAATTPCGDPTDTACDNPDTCDGVGTCEQNYEADTTECRADGGQCDVEEYCDGLGSCPADVFESGGTACGDPADTDCTNPDSCDGANNCLANHETVATGCGSGADTNCDNPDSCDGVGNCDANNELNLTPCGFPTDTECDNPDTCQGGVCDSGFEPDGTGCDDSAFCNGGDSCLAGNCATHVGSPCSGPDGDGDCSETCNEADDNCDGNDTNGSFCNDADVCTTGESCSSGTCGGGLTDACDDGDLCTADSCHPTNGCENVGEPVDPVACVVAGRFKVGVKDTGVAAKNSIRWGWKKGAPVDPSEIVAPNTQSWSVCVYDQTAGTPNLVGSYTVPAGALWAEKPGSVKFSDKTGTNNGVTSINGRASLTAGKSGMDVKIAGANLLLPTAFSATEFFDADPSVVVQLLNSGGTCWTTEFTPTQTKKNTVDSYKAVGP